MGRFLQLLGLAQSEDERKFKKQIDDSKLKTRIVGRGTVVVERDFKNDDSYSEMLLAAKEIVKASNSSSS